MDYCFEFILILWMLIVTVYCVLVSKMNQLRSFDPHGNFEKQVGYHQKGLCKGYVLEWNIAQNLQKRR